MITIPTTQQLYTAILADIEAEFNVQVNAEGKTILRAFAAVQAAKLKQYYLAIGQLQKNIFIDTANPASMGGTLERFGYVKLGEGPFPAVQGQYACTVTGDIGSTIPGGTTFKSDDDSTSPGKLFILDTAFTLAATTETITLRALTAGTDSALVVNDTLTATAPINNVDSAATVSAITTEPQDSEDIEAYRTRGINSYRLEPQGGAASDYRLWSAEAQGVVRSYPYTKSGAPNEVDLYIEGDIDTDKGVPSAGVLSAVTTAITVDPDNPTQGRKPLGVFAVNVQAIIPLDVVITIDDFEDKTTAKETLITTALEEAIYNIRPFIAASDIEADRNDVLSINKIINVVLDAVPNARFGTVSMTINGNAETSYLFEDGAIPYFMSVTINEP